MPHAITATPDAATAKVAITCTGGTPGETVFVFRSDSEGLHLVRDSYAGLVWPGSDPLLVDDHEAHQGGQTDYLLTDVDGTLLDSDVNVAIPAWGTWLKSPGLPARNVRVHLHAIRPLVRPARRARYVIEGAEEEVVLTQRRGGAVGGLALAITDESTAAAVDLILADGETVMIDAHPDWRLPYRYISVGQVAITRPMLDGDSMGFEFDERIYELTEVVKVTAPVGPTSVASDWNYDQLAATAPNYAALSVLFADYDAMAAGTTS